MSIVGKKVKSVRKMTKKEMKTEGWSSHATVIVFEDGSKVFASCDEEGNGPGCLFGMDEKGKGFYLMG